jgi:hypothetical protein
MPFLRTAMTRRALIWLICFCVVAPFVYAVIQAYWATLLVPMLKTLGVRSRLSTLAVILLSDAFAALLAAYVLVCPLVLLARRPAVVLGLVLGTVTILVLAIIAPLEEAGDIAPWTRIVEYAAFVVFCTLAGYSTGRWLTHERAQPFAEPDAR